MKLFCDDECYCDGGARVLHGVKKKVGPSYSFQLLKKVRNCGSCVKKKNVQLGKALGERDEEVTAGGLSKIDVVNEEKKKKGSASGCRKQKG